VGKKVKINRPPIDIWVSRPKASSCTAFDRKEEREAYLLLSTNDLEYGEVTRKESDEYPAGIVIDQNPRSMIMVEAGTIVNFVVSEGSKVVKTKMGDYRGKPLSSVNEKLKELGFESIDLKYKESTKYKEGIIISQSPEPNAEITLDDTINFVVSKGQGKWKKDRQLFKLFYRPNPKN